MNWSIVDEDKKETHGNFGSFQFPNEISLIMK